MVALLQYAGAGLLLGTMAGISPGPLLALVINQSLRHGKKEGIKVAFTPLLTDLPAILLSIYLVTALAEHQSLFGYIAIVGATYIIYLGAESIISAGKETKISSAGAGSLKKGVLTNLLNPHPYMFWISVGTPLMIKALEVSVFAVVVFVLAFYVTIIGSKVILAILTDKSRSFLKGAAYRWALRVLGFLLIILAFMLAWEGWNYITGV